MELTSALLQLLQWEAPTNHKFMYIKNQWDEIVRIQVIGQGTNLDDFATGKATFNTVIQDNTMYKIGKMFYK